MILIVSSSKRIFNFGKEMFMKKTNSYSGNFAEVKFHSHKLLAVMLIAVIGLSMAACSMGGDEDLPYKHIEPEKPKEKEENLFVGEWEGNITASDYAGYGEIPIALTVTGEGLRIVVMDIPVEGTYTVKGNVITVLYFGEPLGTGTLNAKGEIAFELTVDGFGVVTGTLKRKGSPTDPTDPTGPTEPPTTPDPVYAITVEFKNAEDVEITIDDFILDEKGTLAITIKETFAKYSWYINGVIGDNILGLVSNNGKTITLKGDADYLKSGNNRLSVKVTTVAGVIYSKTVIFTVEGI
jgi:hypothetical protein